MMLEIFLTLKGQEFHIWNKTTCMGKGEVPYTEQSPKTKENDVKMILSSLAYIIPIRLSFYISTGERES